MPGTRWFGDGSLFVRQTATLLRTVPPRTCQVTYQDAQGCRHSVEITAESLYEAAGLALDAFRQAPFIDPNPGPASRLEVEVREPAVRHVVTVLQVEKWAASGSTDPRDGIRKKRLAETLSRKR
jgi:hypothetical protein